jgi:hypothetical protein
MTHHPTYTTPARKWFAATCRTHGGYDTVAATLEAAGLPRPSQGSPEYRTAIVAALEAGRALATDAAVVAAAAADPERALLELARQMGAL